MASSHYVDALRDEGAYAVMVAANALEAEGRDIVHLEIGQPDFPTPPHIVRAGVAALEGGETNYSNPSGTPDLRAAVAAHVSSTRGLVGEAALAASNVVVGPGAKPGLFFSAMALLQPGDEVVVPDPGFPTYRNMALAFGATPVPVRLAPPAMACFDFDRLQAALNERTRVVLINSPSNPTGGVIDVASLRRIGELCARWPRIHIITDEIYSKLTYGDSGAEAEAEAEAAKAPSFLSVATVLDAEAGAGEGGEYAALAPRTILIDGFSKTYCMTGWRLGFAVMSAALASRVHLLMVHSVGCTATFTQSAGVAALADEGGASEAALGAMVEEYQKRRDRVVEALNGMDGVTCACPAGAFYVFPDVSALLGAGSPCTTAAQLAARILSEGGVALLPGTDFGAAGEGYLRLSYVRDMSTLEEGMKRMAAVVKAVRAEGQAAL